jgi:hypothetical protein
MLRQAVRLTPSASQLSQFPCLFTKKPKEAPPESLTEKWLKGLFDEEPKPKKEDPKSNRKDDDDREGGQMMPIPSGVPGLYYSREVHF